jgi:uncharacterized protein YkwD
MDKNRNFWRPGALALVGLIAIVYGCGNASDDGNCTTTGNEVCACQGMVGVFGVKMCANGKAFCYCQPVSGLSGSSAAGSAALSGVGGGIASNAGSAATGASGKSGGNAGTTTSAAGKAGGGGGKAGSTTTAKGGSSATGAAGSSGPHNAAEVCERWKADRVDMSEGTWSGSVSGCNPGDISANGRENALRIVNLYRWLADLSAVTTDDNYNKKAQACALIMKANNQLSHTPPNTWTCWTQEGADGAKSCNISTGPGVSSVDGYMIDPGNPTTIGHRRWILSNMFGPTGLGSTDGASCLWTMGAGTMWPGGNKAGSKPWMAWPAPGAIPYQAIRVSMYGGFQISSLDNTGWTIQSDTINLSSAQVSVTADGQDLKVTVTQLLGGYGSTYALRFNPDGWQTAAGKTYTVSVTGTSTPISYQVEVVDCS